MKPIESFLLLFTDSFFNNIILSIKKPIMIHTMLHFGYNTIIVYSIYFMALICASLFNYYSGILAYNIYISLSGKEPKNYMKARLAIHRFFYVIMFISAIFNFAKFTDIFLGITKFSLKKLIITSLLFNIIVVLGSKLLF